MLKIEYWSLIMDLQGNQDATVSHHNQNSQDRNLPPTGIFYNSISRYALLVSQCVALLFLFSVSQFPKFKRGWPFLCVLFFSLAKDFYPLSGNLNHGETNWRKQESCALAERAASCLVVLRLCFCSPLVQSLFHCTVFLSYQSKNE